MSQMPRKPRPTKKSPGFYQSNGPDSTDVTVYQSGGQAVVREQRTLELSGGENAVFLNGMPGQYQDNSLIVLEYEGVLNTGGLSLGPISYRAANLDKARILQGSTDMPVTVEKYLGNGHVERVAGVLKAVFGTEAAIERADNRNLFFAQIAQVELTNGVPAGLSATPSLMLTPKAKADGAYKIRFLYETGGFGWSARHSAFYDEKAGKLTVFETSVNVTNASGAAFKNAKLRLMAGSNYGRRGGAVLEAASFSPMAAGAPPKGGARAASFDVSDSVQESVGDTKMYTLSDPVTIADGEKQQVTLVRGEDVKVNRQYFLPSGWYQQAKEEDCTKQGVNIRLRMVNDADSNLGSALPAGYVQIFQNDSSGSPQKIGATNIGHVAEGEKFKLEFGPSSTVKAVRRLIDTKYTEVPRPPKKEDDNRAYPMEEGPHSMSMGPAVHRVGVRPPVQEQEEPLRFQEEEREIIIFNYKDEAVTVHVTEHMDAEVEWLKGPEHHEFAAESPGVHTVKVAVEPNGKVALSYRIKWQINQ